MFYVILHIFRNYRNVIRMGNSPVEFYEMLEPVDSLLVVYGYEIVDGKQLLHPCRPEPELEKLVRGVPQIYFYPEFFQVRNGILQGNITDIVSEMSEESPWNHIHEVNVRYVHSGKLPSEILVHFRKSAEPSQLAEIYQYVFHPLVLILKFTAYKCISG
jgi:hypothetical protein